MDQKDKISNSYKLYCCTSMVSMCFSLQNTDISTLFRCLPYIVEKFLNLAAEGEKVC